LFIYSLPSPHDRNARTPPAHKPEVVADALAFALRFDGRRGKQDAGEFMAQIVAKRLVEHLE
jgi:hypothetical protein